MRTRLRQHLTYANVMSTIAVFIVLGGGAYAATKLPKNSVGTKQIKNGAVTKAKLAKRLSTKGDTGPRGAQGPQGAQGIQGAQGVQGVQGERGPSSGRVIKGTGADLDAAAPTTLATLAPTGDSVVTAKALLVNSGTAGPVSCVLALSGHEADFDPIDISEVVVPANGAQVMTLTGGAAASTDGVVFACRAPAGGPVHAQNIRLTAVQVGSLTIG